MNEITGYNQELDLSRCNALVRNVLRKMRVETVGQLLELEEWVLLSMEGCGPKTTARILTLQAEYGKNIVPAKPRTAIEEVLAESVRFVNGLSAVARAGNEVINAGKKDEQNRYYFRVTTKCFNTLKRSLEALGK